MWPPKKRKRVNHYHPRRLFEDEGGGAGVGGERGGSKCMSSYDRRILLVLAIFVTVVVFDFSSCVHTTQLNELYINPIDTTHFSFVRMTVSGGECTVLGHTQIGFPSDPWSQSIDTTYNSIINRSDSLQALPSTFVNDTLLLWDHVTSEWDSVHWQFRIVIDSTRTHFISVSWMRDTDAWDGIFDRWWKSNCDTIFDVPLTRMQDGSLTANILKYNGISVFSDSGTYSDGGGYNDITTSINSLDSLAPNASIDLLITP